MSDDWDRLMTGAYVNGGWMIINDKTVGVNSFDHEAPEAEHDWVLFMGEKYISSHRTLREAKQWAVFVSEW